MRSNVLTLATLLIALAPRAPLPAQPPPAAADAIKRLGGTFEMATEGDPATVVKVDLHRTAVMDSDLAFLVSLPGLEILDLRLTKVGDGALDHVKGLTHLKF